jgi:hypothetical protein
VHVSAIVTPLIFEHAGAGQGARVVFRDRGDGAVASPDVEKLGIPIVLVVREGARRSGPLGGQRGDGQHQAQGEGGEPDGSYVICLRLHETRVMHLPRST